MLLQSFLERSAVLHPDKVALISGRRRLTYREVDAAANRFAYALRQSGLQRGDRVVIALPNVPETVIAVYGTLKAGGVFVMHNPDSKGGKLRYVLEKSRAFGLVTAERDTQALQVLDGLPHLRRVWLSGEPVAGMGSLDAAVHDDRFPVTAPEVPSIDIDLAALLYTSASSGPPKGVMLTHHNMVAAAASITTYLESREDDVVSSVLPLSFDYGLYQVLMAFKMGATVILERSFAFPRVVLQNLVRERATGFPIVPTMSAMLLQLDLSEFDLSSLRYITNTAAALPVHHITQLRRILPWVRIYSMYGLTECKRVSYLPPDQIDIRPASVGRGMPNEEVYIVDEDGNRAGPNVTGELVVRGANVMQGYWDDPEETAKRLRPGPYPWEKVLYTGDLFRADEEGYLYFVGRRDDLIKTRGIRVSPREIEDVLHELDGVVEAAVVGIPDPLLGEAVAAAIVRRPESGLTERDVVKFCAGRLDEARVPKRIEFRDRLPKSENGKIAKKEIVFV
ncbi:MAG: AMP-binding protein [Bryobacterales bacterium]|nr:AMP-binding protein [Bryobacterales bacterium]